MGIYLRRLIVAVPLLCPAVSGFTQSAATPVEYNSPGSVYTQDFNGLPAAGSFALTGKGPANLSSAPVNGTGLTGWQVWMKTGTNANLGFAVSTGSSTGSNVYSLGVSQSTDRALGTLASGTGVYAFGVILTNTTGLALNSCSVSFTVEQWRKGGSGNINTWSFQYATGVFDRIDQPPTTPLSELDMRSVVSTTSAATLNGNLPENRRTVSFTLQNIYWKSGEQLLLRWDDADETGSDDACSIDDLSFSAQQVVMPPTTILALTPHTASLTNASSVLFIMETAQPVAGISAANFSVVTQGITGAAVTAVNAVAGNLTITVNTGTGDGNLSLHFIHDNGTSAPIHNKPFSSASGYTIDKSPPSIRSAGIPDRPMKFGDTVEVTLHVDPDTGHYQVSVFTINGINATRFRKANDSTYTAIIVITSGADISAASDIPTLIVITDSAGNSNSPYQVPVIQSSDLIDATRPVLSSAQLPPNGLYRSGDTLDFIFRFSEKIMLSGSVSSSTISLTIGTRSKPAFYVSGNGSDTLVYRYIIQPGESDKDGIRFTSPLTFHHVMITDMAGNPGVLSYSFPSSAKILADGVIPVISSVSTPPAAVYRTGNILDFTANFSKKIWLDTTGGSPFITITIGNAARRAYYSSGSGSSFFLFRYHIQGDDMDKDGIRLGAAIDPNHAHLQDEAGNTAVLQLNGIGALSHVLINPPTVAITCIVLPADSIYKTGDTLFFTALFNETVTVHTADGIPSIRFTSGSTIKHAGYAYGSGSNTLCFAYTVAPGDLDSNGITINSTISFNNGSIKDERNNTIPVMLNNMGSSAGIHIDAVQPSVRSVLTPPRNTYRKDDTLDFEVVFSESVWTTGDIFINLQIGDTVKKAMYVSGSGRNTILFRYVIQPGDNDRNGIRIDSLIFPVDGYLYDRAGNPAIPVLKNIGALSGIRIVTATPQFVTGDARITVCANTDIPVHTLLQAKYEEKDELLSWKIIKAPVHGTVSAHVYTTVSNGAVVTPGKIVYSPDRDYAGQDSMLVELTDSSSATQKTICIELQPSVTNNAITSAQTICAGMKPAMLYGTYPSGGNNTYSFTWEVSATNDSTGFKTVSGIYNKQSYTPEKLNANTWFRRKVISGMCTHHSQPVTISVLKTGIWTGGFDTNWNNPNNWCAQTVPSLTTDVWIDGNALFQPVVRDSASCHNLRLLNNARMIITGYLRFAGETQTNDGRIDATQGHIILKGNSTQTLSPSVFLNNSVKQMTIQNPAGVSVNASMIITGTLQLQSGSLITNDHVRLSSSAIVGPSAENSGITGKLSIEHTIAGGRKAFRLMGHPFTTAIDFSMIKDSVDITGEGGSVNGFVNSVSYSPSAFVFDPFSGNDSIGIHPGWKPVTSITGTWEANKGIRLLVRGRPGQGLDGTPAGDGTNGTYLPAPVQLLFSGQVHTGDLEMILHKNLRPAYHVIANPYPSPIDLARITRGKGIAPHYWLWDPLQGNTGGYRCVRAKDNTILPPFGAFIARVNEDNGNHLLFTENSKSLVPQAIQFGDNYIELQLRSGNTYWDKVRLFAVDSARIYSDGLDAEQFPNEEVNFYSISRDKKQLSIDARPIGNTSVIPLGLQTGLQQSFTIRITGMKMPAENTLQLHDRYLEKWMPLEKDSSYTFTVTADTLSQGDHRFEISTYRKPADTAAVYKFIASLGPVPAHDKITIRFTAPAAAATSVRLLSQSGIVIKQFRLGIRKDGQIDIPLENIPSGIYLAVIQCGEYATTQKIIKQ